MNKKKSKKIVVAIAVIAIFALFFELVAAFIPMG